MILKYPNAPKAYIFIATSAVKMTVQISFTMTEKMRSVSGSPLCVIAYEMNTENEDER